MVSHLQRIVRNLVIASPFFFPAFLLRFKVAGIPFTALEVFIYLLFGLWLIESVRDRRNVVWDKPIRRLWYAAFALVIGAAIGVVFSPITIVLQDGTLLNARQVSLGIWKGWVLAPVLYCAVLTQVLRSYEDVRKVLRAFLYSAALVGLGSHLLALFGDGLTIDFRLRGFYASANELALVVVPAILVAVAFLFQRHRPPNRWDSLDLFALAIVSYTLFFTQSYAGILAVFGSLALFVLLQFFRNPAQRRAILSAFIVMILAFAAVLATQINTPKFKQFLDFENRSSTSVRLQIYQVAWDLVKKHPLDGVGPGLFQASYREDAALVLGQPPMEWDMPHPHNIFLAFWLNAGLLGLAAFVALLVFSHRRFTYPLLALWAIVIHGFFDTPFWKNDLAMIFWLVIVAIVVLQKERG